MTRHTPYTDARLEAQAAEVLASIPREPYELAEFMEGWRGDALCAQVGGEFFFPEKNDSGREAKRICGMCAVRSQCLLDTLAKGDEYDETCVNQGIYAGFNARSRVRIRQLWGLPASGSARSRVVTQLSIQRHLARQ